MNINSIVTTARTSVTVTPVDATASGSFQLGLGSGKNLTDIDQVHAVAAVAVTGATVNLLTGVSTITGGSQTGGAGKDADGQDVLLSEVGCIHVRNDGETTLLLDMTKLGADTDNVADLPIKAGGEFFYKSQDAVANAEIALTEQTGGETISFTVVTMGKQ